MVRPRGARVALPTVMDMLRPAAQREPSLGVMGVVSRLPWATDACRFCSYHTEGCQGCSMGGCLRRGGRSPKRRDSPALVRHRRAPPSLSAPYPAGCPPPGMCAKRIETIDIRLAGTGVRELQAARGQIW